MVVGSGFRTEDTIAHLNDIQINLYDAVFAPKELYQDREICLDRLAEIGARVEGEDVFGCLL